MYTYIYIYIYTDNCKPAVLLHLSRYRTECSCLVVQAASLCSALCRWTGSSTFCEMMLIHKITIVETREETMKYHN